MSSPTVRVGASSSLHYLIEHLTDTGLEDRSLVLHVCESASSSEAKSKEAVGVIQQQLESGEPLVKLAAVRLWTALLRNPSTVFVTQSARLEFLDTLEDVAVNRQTSPVVREHLLEAISIAAAASKADISDGFRRLLNRVKIKLGPDEDAPSGSGNVATKHPVSDVPHAYETPPATPLLQSDRNNPFTQSAKPQSEEYIRTLDDCKIGKENSELLSQALAFAKPEDLKKHAIREFHMKCRTSKKKLEDAISWAFSEAERSELRTEPSPRQEITAERSLFKTLVDVIKGLSTVLRAFDDIERSAQRHQANGNDHVGTSLRPSGADNPFFKDSYQYSGAALSPQIPPTPQSLPASASPTFTRVALSNVDDLLSRQAYYKPGSVALVIPPAASRAQTSTLPITPYSPRLDRQLLLHPHTPPPAPLIRHSPLGSGGSDEEDEESEDFFDHLNRLPDTSSDPLLNSVPHPTLTDSVPSPSNLTDDERLPFEQALNICLLSVLETYIEEIASSMKSLPPLPLHSGPRFESTYASYAVSFDEKTVPPAAPRTPGHPIRAYPPTDVSELGALPGDSSNPSASDMIGSPLMLSNNEPSLQALSPEVLLFIEEISNEKLLSILEAYIEQVLPERTENHMKPITDLRSGAVSSSQSQVVSGFPAMQVSPILSHTAHPSNDTSPSLPLNFGPEPESVDVSRASFQAEKIALPATQDRPLSAGVVSYHTQAPPYMLSASSLDPPSYTSVLRQSNGGLKDVTEALLPSSKYENGTSYNDLTGQVIKLEEKSFASGGFSDIFKGLLVDSSKGNSRTVVIKTLRILGMTGDDDVLVKTRKYIARETSVWATLNHRNVLPFLGLCRDLGPSHALIAPYCEGGDVLTYLNKKPDANRFGIVSGVTSGLNYLHSQGVIHGDLKCQNVLIKKNAEACICDFGISKLVDRRGFTTVLGGTLTFMAPELLGGDSGDDEVMSATKPSDVYAYGLVALQIFTGVQPPRWPVNAAITRDRYNSSELTDSLWEIFSDCCALDFKLRPEIGQVMQRLSHSEY